MLGGGALLAFGLVFATWAIRIADRAARPVSLAAALGAAAGLAAALIGATRLLLPRF